MQLPEFVSQSWLLTPNFGQCSPWEEAMTVQDWGSCHLHGQPGPSFSPNSFLPGLAFEEGRQAWQHSLYVSFSLPLCSAFQINIETPLHTRHGVNPTRDFPVRYWSADFHPVQGQAPKSPTEKEQCPWACKRVNAM